MTDPRTALRAPAPHRIPLIAGYTRARWQRIWNANSAAREQFSAAQGANVDRWIMLASGVVVPQGQARWAEAFPPFVGGEALSAAVSDADRQLLQHHIHRHHPASTRVSRGHPQCGSGSRREHLATPREAHPDRPNQPRPWATPLAAVLAAPGEVAVVWVELVTVLRRPRAGPSPIRGRRRGWHRPAS